MKIIQDLLAKVFELPYPFGAIVFCTVSVVICISAWFILTWLRAAKWYLPVWLIGVLLLTLCWGATIINYLITPSGWASLDAAIYCVLVIPLFVLDIIFLLRWPRKKSKDQGQPLG